MADTVTSKWNENGNGGERMELLSNAYWEEIARTPIDPNKEGIRASEIQDDCLRTMMELDLATSKVAKCVRKAEKAREEAEKIGELLASKIARLDGNGDGSPEVEETAANLAELGDEVKNTEESRDEAEGQTVASETAPEEIEAEASSEVEEAVASPAEHGEEEISTEEFTGRSGGTAGGIKNGSRRNSSQSGPKTAKRKRARKSHETKQRRELAAHVTAQVEVAPQERPTMEGSVLEQCMSIPSFRARVISRLVEKLR